MSYGNGWCRDLARLGRVERAEAEELGRRGGWAGFVGEFVPTDPDGLIYLDGNSLGRLPKRTAARLRHTIEHEWGGRLIRSWDDWMDLPTTVGDELGTNLLGAGPGHTALADSTTVNLYKLATAALRADEQKRNTILTTRDNFPTDRYLFDHIAEVRYLDTEAPTAEQIAEATKANDIALVSLSHVSYKNGALLDAEAITQAAHANQAQTLWDLSHSAGAVTVELEKW